MVFFFWHSWSENKAEAVKPIAYTDQHAEYPLVRLTRNLMHFSTACAEEDKWKKESRRNSARQKVNVLQHHAQEDWRVQLEQKVLLASQRWGPLQPCSAEYFLTGPKQDELMAVYRSEGEVCIWRDSGWIYSGSWKIKAWFKSIFLFCFLWDSQQCNHSMRFK